MNYNKVFSRMRSELRQIAEKEEYKLYRVANNLQRRGGSSELVAAIRDEANMIRMYYAFPDRLLDKQHIDYYFKYAFKF